MPWRPSFYDAVWTLVRRVPRGRVVTYGQLATWLGSPRAARAVGYAMFNVDDPGIPWHRVINARGEISVGGALHRPELQRELLVREGVVPDGAGRVDLRRYGWMPSPRELRRFLTPAGLPAREERPSLPRHGPKGNGASERRRPRGAARRDPRKPTRRSGQT